LSNNSQESQEKILIIGLGQIGYSNAKYITSKGLWVEGYDVSQQASGIKFYQGNGIINI
jgi:UDP-N-acetyl-D-mannosaminuronic acid dehydrogenase